MEPPKGHVAGGTTLWIYGDGFANSPRLTVRFARGTEVSEASARWVSRTAITVVTPQRSGAGWTQVTVSNDGEAFSAMPNVYTKGSGSFLAYVYDDSKAGFYDGVRKGVNVHGYHESWTVSNATGPYIGGTIVRIEARGLDLGSNTLLASDKYTGPSTGAGTPNPNFPDANATFNSPPVTGTFYPGSHLTVKMSCDIDLNGDGSISGSESFTKTVTPIWHSYVLLEFETPPMDPPSTGDSNTGAQVLSTTCRVYVSNDGTNYDYTNATFVYADPTPTVSSIHTAQMSVWGARGPFGGKTEVVVRGTNFLPSKYLACKFGGVSEPGKPLYMSHDVTHVVSGRWVSSTEVRCITPAFGPAALTNDGSISPAHQDLVQVSNNFKATATSPHSGYRDTSASPVGYWIWSRDTGNFDDCKVSTNPPLNFYDGVTLMGHSLDKGTGWIVGGDSNPILGVLGNQDRGDPLKTCLFFLYGDVYVSPSGSDETGHGTAVRPYRTIQKCVNAALTGVREGGVNVDRCILKDGAYWGPGNRELRANGRVVEVSAENPGKAIIDCEGLPIGRQVYAKRDPTRATAPGAISTHGVTFMRCGFKQPYAADTRQFYPGYPMRASS